MGGGGRVTGAEVMSVQPEGRRRRRHVREAIHRLEDRKTRVRGSKGHGDGIIPCRPASL